MTRMGRPREFDRVKAVDSAMMLFWAQGYEPTSLSQLKASMGDISAASFYAAFGSKEGLFNEVVARYLNTHGQATSSLKDAALSPREAIETALTRSARMQTEATHPRGCFIVTGASNCAPENRHIDQLLENFRKRDRMAIEACVSRAVASGELSSRTNVAGLSTMISSFLVGVAIEARDGTPTERLLESISTIMELWDMNRSEQSGVTGTIAASQAHA